jgi:hypothetical protein
LFGDIILCPLPLKTYNHADNQRHPDGRRHHRRWLLLLLRWSHFELGILPRGVYNKYLTTHDSVNILKEIANAPTGAGTIAPMGRMATTAVLPTFYN